MGCGVQTVLKPNFQDFEEKKDEILFFNTRIEAIMDSQRTRDWSEDFKKCPIPLGMKALIQHIKYTGGLKCEGIFRIAAGKDELEKITKQLEIGTRTGVFAFEEFISPHVPAVILKRWLRSLENLLIPEEMFEAAMLLLKKSEDKDFKRGDLLSEDMKLKVGSFIDNLPKDHRSALNALLEFLLEVSRNSKENRMNLSNLAIVFGPCVARNPQLNWKDLVRESQILSDLMFLLLSCGLSST
ncbi:hypothetical protein AAMO2058_000928300 [Amorphochlora amoebiformis]